MSGFSEDTLLFKQIEQICKPDLVSVTHFRGELTLEVKSSALAGILDALREAEGLRMNFLADIVGVDLHPEEPRFAVLYHMYSTTEKMRLRVKVVIEDGEKVQSVTPLWKSAGCAEREVYDMFGIEFEGHENLRRVYLADDWVGHPLRKDYPLRGYKDEYNPFGEERPED